MAPDDSLPTGAHPLDRSEPVVPGFGSLPTILPPDRDSPAADAPTTAPYRRDQWDIVQVYDRAATTVEVDIRLVLGTAQDGGVTLICNTVEGRKSVTLTVPTRLPSGGTPAGIMWSANKGALQQGGLGGVGVLNPGDSTTIYAECSLWAAPLPGAPSGAVQIQQEISPPGGVQP